VTDRPTPAGFGCSLDAAGLGGQRARYAAIGRTLLNVERSATAISLELTPAADAQLVEETIAIERRCCPFFRLEWDAPRRLLRVAVDDPEHAPALDAIGDALGLPR
jgi:hypothetical protein